jgi:hypothetical protein
MYYFVDVNVRDHFAKLPNTIFNFRLRFMQDIFLAGTDTTSSTTIEWALAELINK